MSSKDEPLREPVVTGTVRMEIYGDRERGIALSHRGRAQLGQMLNYHGVPERIAAGEPGGFFHSSRNYPGGYRIQTLTNNGQHTVRIFVPPLPKPVPEVKEEKPEEEPLPKPYMWIGVRVKYDAGKVPDYAPRPFVIEPDNEEAVGIVCSQPYSGDDFLNWFEVDIDGDHVVTLEEDSAGEDIDTLMDGLQSSWDEFWPGLGKERRHHNLAAYHFDAPGGFGGLYFSKNGLRLYENITFDDGTTPLRRWLPWDPQMTPEQNLGEGRDFSGREESASPSPSAGWDHVFVLDPFDEEGEEPCDARDHILKMRQFLESVGMSKGEAQVLNGTYVFGVCAYAEGGLSSDRTGERIPGFDDFFLRSAKGDYTQHLTDSGYVPMSVEVEIRLGKGEFMETFNFELTCAQYDDRSSNVTPFGLEEFDPCFHYGGKNPFGPNYAQQVIEIDVWGRSATMSDQVPPRFPIFGGGTYQNDGDPRVPVDIYIYGDYFPPVSQATYADKAAAAIFQVMEAMTAGVYGWNIMSERSSSDIFGGVAGIHLGSIWRYDCVANTITELPVISDIGDYDYVTPPAWYKPWLFWYYPYMWQSLDQCRNVFAIVLQSTAEYIYNGDQSGGPDYERPEECC